MVSNANLACYFALRIIELWKTSETYSFQNICNRFIIVNLWLGYSYFTTEALMALKLIYQQLSRVSTVEERKTIDFNASAVSFEGGLLHSACSFRQV